MKRVKVRVRWDADRAAATGDTAANLRHNFRWCVRLKDWEAARSCIRNGVALRRELESGGPVPHMYAVADRVVRRHLENRQEQLA